MRLRDASLTKYSTQLFASEDLARTAQRFRDHQHTRSSFRVHAQVMEVVRSVPGAPKKMTIVYCPMAVRRHLVT